MAAENRRVGTAHDAGESDRATAVGDHQEVGFQGVLLVVQQLDAFARGGHSNHDAVLQLVQIVGMQRLAQFHHHKVGDVDDGRDAVEPHAPQALLEPRWRFGHPP